ncbi:TetR/AcrR family transcriptional regulator [Rhodococcus aerolatus]
MTTTGQRGTDRPSARERLLRAADELFYAEGIASTGVDAVVDRAGVATGSLYNNFGGKDGLVAAYLTDRDERWRAIWQACVAEQDDPVERVLAVFTAVQRWGGVADVHRGCALLAAAVQLPAGHPGQQVAADHKRHLAARLRELCAAAGVPDPSGAAADVLLVYEGLQNFVALGLDPDPVARARRLAATRLGQPGSTA